MHVCLYVQVTKPRVTHAAGTATARAAATQATKRLQSITINLATFPPLHHLAHLWLCLAYRTTHYLTGILCLGVAAHLDFNTPGDHAYAPEHDYYQYEVLSSHSNIIIISRNHLLQKCL